MKEHLALMTTTIVKPRPKFTVLRFALDAPVLPLVTDTLPLAEDFRRELLRKCWGLARRAGGEPSRQEICVRFPSITGKDADGRPLRGHGHAFFLPADEDGDGRLDHVTVVAAQGFTADEVRALDRLREVRFGDGDPLRLLLVALGTEAELRSRLLEQSAVWVSATPFLATRYPKLRGRKRDQPEQYATPQEFARHVLREELERLRQRRRDGGSELPEVVSIEPLEGIGPRRLRPIQFHRFRQKRADDGGRRPSGSFRIVFQSPTRGPLCLGHSCHFGLGLFVLEEGSTAVAASPAAQRAERW